MNETSKNNEFMICVVHNEEKVGIGAVSPVTLNLCRTYRAAGVFGKHGAREFSELKSIIFTPLDIHQALEDFTVLIVDEPLFAHGYGVAPLPGADKEETDRLVNMLKECTLVGGMPHRTKIMGKVPEAYLKSSETLREYLISIVNPVEARPAKTAGAEDRR